MVPEEPAQHDQEAGGRVPELLLRQNTTDTRRQEAAKHVLTHTEIIHSFIFSSLKSFNQAEALLGLL